MRSLFGKSPLKLTMIMTLIAGLHIAAADEVPSGDKKPVPSVSIDQIQALVDAAKYPEAVKKGREYLKADRNPLVYTLVGFSLRKQKKWDEAIGSYRTALTIDRNFHQAKEYLAVAYLNKKEPNKARILYDDLLQTEPNLAKMLKAEANKLGYKW